MTRPAVWDDDPPCGHQVACAYQTHYCTYIRVPRLLTLQAPQTADPSTSLRAGSSTSSPLPSVGDFAGQAVLLITAHQWYELWFKVLLTDLRAALADDCTTYEPVKLLQRGIELFKLFDLHADFAESVVVREAGLTQAVCVTEGGVVGVSGQFSRIAALSRRVSRLEQFPFPGLTEAAQEYTARFKAFRARYHKFLESTLIPRKSKSPTYSEWLRLPELLDLQDGVKSAWTEAGQQPTALWKPDRIGPDENMFIIVHQCFEIWFQVILDHIDRAIPAMLRGDIASATRLLRRVALLQRWLAQQIRIPATMLPLDFLRFRDQKMEKDGKVFKTGLTPASGTESYQFREIEIACGLRDDPVFQKYLAGTEKLPIRLLTPRQAERMKQPTLPEAFRHAVRQRGIERFDDLFTPADTPNPHTDLAQLADTLLEFDEFFRAWRLNHVSMVEKMIGARSGTGFLGPEYLMETAGIKIQEKNRIFEERQVRPRFFEELWAVRTRLGVY